MRTTAFTASVLLALSASDTLAAPMELVPENVDGHIVWVGHGPARIHTLGKPSVSFGNQTATPLVSRSIISSIAKFFGKESGTIAKDTGSIAKVAAKDGTMVVKGSENAVSEVASAAKKTGMATWKKVALVGGGLVGGGLLLDHVMGSGDSQSTSGSGSASSGAAAATSCPGQGGDDSNQALDSSEIQQFQQSAQSGLSQYIKNQLLCFTPLTTKDYGTISGIVNSVPTLYPTDGGAFTSDDLNTIESNVCQLSGDDKSTYLSQVLATPGIIQSETAAINAASNGQCPSS